MTSIYDIAAKAGVSPTTVSLVLNGKSDKLRISQKTRERILAAAAELKYVPNAMARKMSNRTLKKTPQVAFFWAPTQNPYILNAFIDKLHAMIASGAIEEVQLSIYPYDNGELYKQEGLIVDPVYNAIILPLVDEDDVRFLDGANTNTPVVTLLESTPRYHSVTIAYREAGRTAAEVFLSHGRTAPAVISSALPIKIIRDRVGAFVERFRESGAEAPPVEREGSTFKPESGYAAASRLLESGRVPDCVFASHAELALGAIERFKAAGLRIPGDIELISFGGDVIAELCSPSLTAITYDLGELSASALTIVSEALAGTVKGPVRAVSPVSIAYRESCPR